MEQFGDWLGWSAVVLAFLSLPAGLAGLRRWAGAVVFILDLVLAAVGIVFLYALDASMEGPFGSYRWGFPHTGKNGVSTSGFLFALYFFTLPVVIYIGARFSDHMFKKESRSRYYRAKAR